MTDYRTEYEDHAADVFAIALERDVTPRELAGEWHGGQSTALYAFASSGYVDRDGLLLEIDRELDREKIEPRQSAENRRELAALRSYVVAVRDDAALERTAIVRGTGITRETIGRYLPAGYRTTDAGTDADGDYVTIAGTDDAGWTMDDYVIPRLASGLYFATETTDADDAPIGENVSEAARNRRH